MPKELPNLAGVASSDLVETIGTGKYSAPYINWSRTLFLLRQNAPGWSVETVAAPDGGLLHRAPVGGYLLIRFRHADGTVTPEVPQAVMDHRNNAIPFEKITARDITDTHRRGACLAAAVTFGLAYELWAKLPLESGFNCPDEEGPGNRTVPQRSSTGPSPAGTVVTREQFLEAALAKGLTTHAADVLLAAIEAAGANYGGGIARLQQVDLAWVADQNAKADPKNSAEQW